MKKFVESDEFQKMILDLITTGEYHKYIDTTIYSSSKEFGAGVIYGLHLAAVSISKCDDYYLKADNEKGICK